MSHFWQKYGNNFGVALKTIDHELVYRTDFCPCLEWYIAAVCPCNSCDEIKDDYFIGEVARDGSGRPLLHEDDTETKVCTLVFTEGQWPGIVADAFAGWYIDCVSHLTRTAPFDCEIYAALYLDGVELAALDATCQQGSSIWLGEGIYEKCWEIKDGADRYEIGSEGAHNLDLFVEMSPIGDGEPVRYAMRYPVRVLPPLQVSSLHDAVIVPSTLINGVFSECPLVAEIKGRKMAVSLTALKGPFISKGMAREVYNEFAEIISAYADSCVCIPPLNYGDCLWPGFISYDQRTGMWLIERFGNTSDECSTAVGSFSSPEPMEWLGDMGTEVRAFRTDIYGNMTEVSPGSGVCGPCERINFFYESEPEVGPEYWSSDPRYKFSGNTWPIGSVNGPCPFCSSDCWDYAAHDWDDENCPHCSYVLHPFHDGVTYHFSDWYYSARANDGGVPHGVPGNTEEYNDWANVAPIAKSAVRQLLGELPEEMV